MIFSKPVGIRSQYKFYAHVYSRLLKIKALPLYHCQFFLLSERILNMNSTVIKPSTLLTAAKNIPTNIQSKKGYKNVLITFRSKMMTASDFIEKSLYAVQW